MDSETKNLITINDACDLISNNSLQNQEKIIRKLTLQYEENIFSESELIIVNDIIRLIVNEATSDIKKIISHNLKNSTHLPHDIILSLAHDIEEISVPILECSAILDDQDLIDIITTTEVLAKKLAICKRPIISEIVSDALIDSAELSVVDAIISNVGALIGERSYDKIINVYI